MKAVRVIEFGQPAQVDELPQPKPASDEVLVRVHAASVNPGDVGIATGYMKNFYPAPLTLGTDFSGEAVEVGADVKEVQPGEAVYGMSRSLGTYAEYAVVKTVGLARKPRSIDDIQAAAIPLAGLTAWQSLFDLARLQSGERILIHGAGGGVGGFAVQLAKNKGAYVIGHEHEANAAHVRRLGADEVIAANSQRFEDVVGRVDVVLDLVGGEMVERSFSVLKPGGRFVTTAARLPQEAGKDQGIVAMGAFIQPNAEELAQLAEMVDAGKLKVFVNRTFPLAETQAALFYRPPEPGKVVITIL